MISRRLFTVGSTLTALIGGTAHAAGLTADDVTVGATDARVHLIEYASSTCPHCAAFHAVAWETLLTRYIDTGRVRFTFREMATAPPAVALAMFQLARCETEQPTEYLRRVGILFERQAAILGTGTGAGVRDALIALGAEWRLSPEQVMACITDPAGPPRITRSIEQAAALGITSTPSFILNGTRLADHSIHTAEDLTAILDARLAAD